MNAAVPYRSSAPRVLGTLAIVFGALDVAAELVNLFRVLAAQDRATMELLGGIGVEMTAVAPAYAGRAVVMLAMSVTLIVLGAGLRTMREPYRLAAVYWSEGAVAVLVGRVVLWEAVIWPHLDRARSITALGFHWFPPLEDLVGSFLQLARFGEYAIVVLLLPFPVVLLAVLGMKRVRASMSP
ncbi:MAG TPA: hypothetical protein VIF09_25415 [Polyangiaceae bacterium]